MTAATDIVSVLGTTIRFATPLILASFGGLYSERAGIVALGLEGMMMAGAFAAGSIAWLTGSAWLGLGAAIVVTACVALAYGWVSITQRGGQIVSAMALNLLMAGLCPALAIGWFGQGGDTPTLGTSQRLMPLVGGLDIVAFIAAGIIPLSALILGRTRFGLRLRVVGENPEAVDALGISVTRLRYEALAICGALAGIAGAGLAIADGTGFTRNLTAGRGYIALAALVFGRWKPAGTTLACLIFAFADALQIRLQGIGLPWVGQVPVALVQAMPALLTVIILALVAGRGAMPTALGSPYPALSERR